MFRRGLGIARVALALFGVLPLMTASAGMAAGTDLDNGLLQAYSAVHEALAADNVPNHVALTAEKAKALNAAAARWSAGHAQGDPAYTDISLVARASTLMASRDTTEAQRLEFAKASRGIVAFLKLRTDLQPAWQLFYCDMVKEYWVQPHGSRINNPYMGTSMPRCGYKVDWEDA